MNAYVFFKISGLKGILVSEDAMEFETPDDDLVEKVLIKQSSGSIDGLQFILKAGQTIDDNVVAALTKKAKVFLVNINGRMYPLVSKFDMELKQVYNPSADHHGTIQVSEVMVLSDSATITQIYKVEVFKEQFTLVSPRTDADDLYNLLFYIMKIDNIVTRYLMQYELLLSLVAPNHRQKEATDYIRDKYNPAQSFNIIGFRPTRRTDRKGNLLGFDEDEITYVRNMLGHNDATVNINDKSIIQWSSALTQVLFFALNNV